MGWRSLLAQTVTHRHSEARAFKVQLPHRFPELHLRAVTWLHRGRGQTEAPGAFPHAARCVGYSPLPRGLRREGRVSPATAFVQ